MGRDKPGKMNPPGFLIRVGGSGQGPGLVFGHFFQKGSDSGNLLGPFFSDPAGRGISGFRALIPVNTGLREILKGTFDSWGPLWAATGLVLGHSWVSQFPLRPGPARNWLVPGGPRGQCCKPPLRWGPVFGPKTDPQKSRLRGAARPIRGVKPRFRGWEQPILLPWFWIPRGALP